MEEVNSEDDDISIEDFKEVVDKIEKKHKKSYKFLTQTGEGFKNSIYLSCKIIIMDKTIPTQFFQTTLHQLWKTKFPKEDFNNH